MRHGAVRLVSVVWPIKLAEEETSEFAAEWLSPSIPKPADLYDRGDAVW